jgi:hypothetical protein
MPGTRVLASRWILAGQRFPSAARASLLSLPITSERKLLDQTVSFAATQAFCAHRGPYPPKKHAVQRDHVVVSLLAPINAIKTATYGSHPTALPAVLSLWCPQPLRAVQNSCCLEPLLCSLYEHTSPLALDQLRTLDNSHLGHMLRFLGSAAPSCSCVCVGKTT